MGELAGIRELIERQFVPASRGARRAARRRHARTPLRTARSGLFSGVLARRLADVVGDGASAEEARAAVKAALTRELRSMSSDADNIDRGACTRSSARPGRQDYDDCQARGALRGAPRRRQARADHDRRLTGSALRSKLAHLRPDLGVPVFSVRDGADLRQTLAELRNKHMELNDTMGMSQRDRMVAEQAAI